MVYPSLNRGHAKTLLHLKFPASGLHFLRFRALREAKLIERL